MSEERVIYAHYVGNGAYLPGLGACDLTVEEWNEAPDETRNQALELGLYELSTPYGVEKASEQ